MYTFTCNYSLDVYVFFSSSHMCYVEEPPEPVQDRSVLSHSTPNANTGHTHSHNISELAHLSLHSEPVRRSLRRLGVKPDTPGLPYYAPAKQCTPRKDSTTSQQIDQLVIMEMTKSRKRMRKDRTVIRGKATNYPAVLKVYMSPLQRNPRLLLLLLLLRLIRPLIRTWLSVKKERTRLHADLNLNSHPHHLRMRKNMTWLLTKQTRD